MDSKLFTGTVDLMILEVLSTGSSYGYEIAQTIFAKSEREIEMKEGSLYPALHRLEKDGMLESYWREGEEGRRRKYYRLSAAGKKCLLAKKKEWKQFITAVNSVLGNAS